MISHATAFLHLADIVSRLSNIIYKVNVRFYIDIAPWAERLRTAALIGGDEQLPLTEHDVLRCDLGDDWQASYQTTIAVLKKTIIALKKSTSPYAQQQMDGLYCLDDLLQRQVKWFDKYFAQKKYYWLCARCGAEHAVPDTPEECPVCGAAVNFLLMSRKIE